MTGGPRKSIVIVGGGATGVILAAHLMKIVGDGFRVALIEKREEVGRGLAYSTALPDHRLNVTVERMSAYADDPLHFLQWFRAEHPDIPSNSQFFAERSEYGRYLSQLFAGLLAAEAGTGRLRRIRGECLHIQPAGSGLDVQLSDGTSLAAHVVILATGHAPDGLSELPMAIRLGSSEDTPVDPQSRVVILGSGLSMIDAWLSLRHRGHVGEVLAISRRGLLPLPHAAKRNPIRLDVADIPLGTELSYFVRWFAELIEETERVGGDWRDVIDGIRPFNRQIWRDWPATAKRRFLEHTKAWWDIHRHRIPTDIHTKAGKAIESGALKLLAAKVVEARKLDDGSTELSLRRRGTTAVEIIDCSRVYDCSGFAKDISRTSTEPLRSLFQQGLVRTDPLQISLDVTTDCAVIDAAGRPSTKLFAAGPLTRGTFFEIDAVPDIRLQAARLAEIVTT
ncbi:MAG: FAD/NAD(P)-binding protein [Mesorhizobium sp.]